MIEYNDDSCPVSSYNEWDLLEEVIVGNVFGSVFPSPHISLKAASPKTMYFYTHFVGGMKKPKFLNNAANKELNEFVNILKSEGVIVRRPDKIKFSKKFKTPNWSSKGMSSSCPRDNFLIIGDKIIEAPMSWRTRYFENEAYRSIFMDYFKRGAKWISAPKPILKDTLYNNNYHIPKNESDINYAINESEIVFDAADFTKCGKDIFVIKSNVTNNNGIEWVQREIGEDYKIHIIETRCLQPIHIDTTFVPLAPGKVLINPKYLDIKKLPQILKSWEILICPEPDIVKRGFFNEKASMCSLWLNMNLLMLDKERVIVEKSQISMINALKCWGFKPILCNFMNFAQYGGAFHCAALDIRRKGQLESYF